MITGACRLDRGIQRQQVGLGGDVADQPDDLVDLAHAAVEQLHALRRALHHITDGFGALAHRIEALPRAAHHFVHGGFHFFGGHRRLLNFAQLLLHQQQQLVDRLGDVTGGLPGFAAAHQHQLVVLAHVFRHLDHLTDHAIQAVDEAVDPARHVTALVARHGAAVDALTQIALALGQGADYLGHRLHARRQPTRPE